MKLNVQEFLFQLDWLSLIIHNYYSQDEHLEVEKVKNLYSMHTVVP